MAGEFGLLASSGYFPQWRPANREKSGETKVQSSQSYELSSDLLVKAKVDRPRFGSSAVDHRNADHRPASTKS